MKRETSISRRSLLVGTAYAALGALTGCTAPEPTAEEPQPELILRYAENQPVQRRRAGGRAERH